MKIEEILQDAGVTDTDAISKVAAAMPANFLPLSEHNKRMASAKQAADAAVQELADFKTKADQEREQAVAEAKAGGEQSAEQVDALKAEIEKLRGEYEGAQSAVRNRDAKAAIAAALKAEGANPAAIDLLAAAAVASVTFGDDGTPSNVEDVIAGVKSDNAGLFGQTVETGEPAAKGTAGKATDAFLAGFGATK